MRSTPIGLLAIGFDCPSADWQEISELIGTSNRLIALKRHLKGFDECGVLTCHGVAL